MSIDCKLAFGAISISGETYVKPCCNIDLPEFFKREHHSGLNSRAMTQLRQELIEGVWPSACKNCQYFESLGSTSMRTIFNDKFQDVVVPMVAEVNDNDIIYADIFLSNKCNSKCLTCSPASSDFWLDEYNYIHNSSFTETQLNNRIQPFTFEDCKNLIHRHPNIQHISFIGGEPTIIDSHFQFLEYLVSTSKSKNISLTYNTNLTGFTNDLLKLWSSFKHVGISISIDGYGKVNEYIRYPFKFSKIENNLDQVLQMDNVDVNLACTLSIFNVVDIPNLFTYWYDKLSKTVKKDKPQFIATYLNRVTFPEHMNYNLLSTEYRSQAIEPCNKLLERIELENLPGSIHTTLTLYKSLLTEPAQTNWQLLNKVKRFITKSDEFRKRNIKDFIPELAKELRL